MSSKLFTPVTLGPLTLRNRTIRSAAFESMCPGNKPSEQLLDYHRSVAAGGVGMTTVAYAAVTRSGLSFDRQLWMRPEIIPGLRRLTDAIHAEGAAASWGTVATCPIRVSAVACPWGPVQDSICILLHLFAVFGQMNYPRWRVPMVVRLIWLVKQDLMR